MKQPDEIEPADACSDLGHPSDTCIDVPIDTAGKSETVCAMTALVLDGLSKCPAGTLLNERALADCLAVSPRTVRRMVAHGQLPAGIKLGGRRIWIAEKVMEFLVSRSDDLATEARKRAFRFAGMV